MMKFYTKPLWTKEEDDLLKAFVDKYGDKTWCDVQKHSGLTQSSKSCRRRWLNHLRPELKTWPFTEKEEQHIIELHAVLGNKWAPMAKELDGRTDNEIKNFWNLRLKRQRRLGLPVYPDEVREQTVKTTSQYGINIDLSEAHRSQANLLKADNVKIPEVGLNHLPPNQCSPYYQSMFANVPTNGGFMRQNPCFVQPVQPNVYNLITSPNMPSRKRVREPETTFPFTDGYAMNQQNPTLCNYPCVESTQELLPKSHLLTNATYSFSPGPLIHGDEKLELPPFQGLHSHEEPNSFRAEQYNPMPNLEPHNTLVQSPLSLYDGLLESVVYGSLGDTRSESPFIQPSLLSHTEVAPASANTIDLGYVGSTSSNARHTSNDGDWSRLYLGEDTYNTM